ncbi:class 1 fructose-bisphosphatase [Roseibium sediminicola]|uniref:Fructose-1,6-bisphosphatase class 1 n=1 Tax=Roseibium sediminicola TaxID=2933272 RepID=A0ABT0GZ20_9HYPH|nr:class 1 fructose-bisphosphatase [Roseibium sp. CAU 1639]MCK7614678.1 class 1 fructose-bisphosphatase [Roseibium sp. CAU 1639]
MTIDRLTLRKFLLQEEEKHGLGHELMMLIEDIGTSCRIIAHQIRNGPFLDILGTAETENVQGETQKQLDVIANDIFLSHLSNCSRVAALVSEEIDNVIWLKDTPKKGDYLVYFDPLDGSSNLNVNMSVGSIFSVVELDEDITDLSNDVVLIKGSKQICAGYALYGPSTSLILSTGNGVNGFTQKIGSGEFLLTFPDMRLPEETAEFAINASRFSHWEPPIRRYVEECLEGPKGPRGKSFNMRWIASMVAEVHRILMRGGVFLYPKDANNASMGGKLRLLYEANPMGFIIEQAGGKASTGRSRILDEQPAGHHQRISVILGSKAEVELIDSYHLEADG